MRYELRNCGKKCKKNSNRTIEQKCFSIKNDRYSLKNELDIKFLTNHWRTAHYTKKLILWRLLRIEFSTILVIANFRLRCIVVAEIELKVFRDKNKNIVLWNTSRTVTRIENVVIHSWRKIKFPIILVL